MRSIPCLFVTVCLFASTICAQDQPKLSPTEQEVVDAHKARIEAGENGQQSADRSMTQSKPESKTKTKAPKNAMARKASPPRNSQ